jgi:hypothetical protein
MANLCGVLDRTEEAAPTRPAHHDVRPDHGHGRRPRADAQAFAADQHRVPSTANHLPQRSEQGGSFSLGATGVGAVAQGGAPMTVAQQGVQPRYGQKGQ